MSETSRMLQAALEEAVPALRSLSEEEAGRWRALDRDGLVGPAGAPRAHWSSVEGEATFWEKRLAPA